jgi:DNA-binding NarL/FixJ family response regulator
MRPALSVAPQHKPLSTREREVAWLIAEGRSNRDIASLLLIAEGTVKKHVGNLMAKLQLPNRTQVAVYVIGEMRP